MNEFAWKLVEIFAGVLAGMALIVAGNNKEKIKKIEGDTVKLSDQIKDREFCPMHNDNMKTVKAIEDGQTKLFNCDQLIISDLKQLKKVLITISRLGVFHNHENGSAKVVSLRDLFDEE